MPMRMLDYGFRKQSWDRMLDPKTRVDVNLLRRLGSFVTRCRHMRHYRAPARSAKSTCCLGTHNLMP
jgi:hypothetical protein